MPNTHTTLARLTDDEFLRHVDNVRDPLTTTELEIEMFRRLNEYIVERKSIHDALIEHGYDDADCLTTAFDLVGLLDQYGISDVRKAVDGAVVLTARQVLEEKLEMLNALADNQIETLQETKGAVAMLSVIDLHEIADAAELEARLQRATEINSIADEVGNLLTRLNSLTQKETSHES